MHTAQNTKTYEHKRVSRFAARGFGFRGLILLAMTVTAGCAPPPSSAALALPTVTMPPVESPVGAPLATPIVSPYILVTVDDVQVRYLPTTPIQIEVDIQGTLPDQCQYTYYSVENRSDAKVKVTLFGIHPSNTACAQSRQRITYTLLLGRDLPKAERGFAPGAYQLSINKYETSLVIR